MVSLYFLKLFSCSLYILLSNILYDCNEFIKYNFSMKLFKIVPIFECIHSFPNEYSQYLYNNLNILFLNLYQGLHIMHHIYEIVFLFDNNKLLSKFMI